WCAGWRSASPCASPASRRCRRWRSGCIRRSEAGGGCELGGRAVFVAAPSTSLRLVPLPRGFATVEDPRVAATATARDPPPRSGGGGPPEGWWRGRQRAPSRAGVPRPPLLLARQHVGGADDIEADDGADLRGGQGGGLHREALAV